jgi:hypothetical protein
VAQVSLVLLKTGESDMKFIQLIDNNPAPAIKGVVEALENQRQGLDKNLGAFEVCTGDVRWRNGLLEQLWQINYLGPNGAIEKTIEEWQSAPASEGLATAGHIRWHSRPPGLN